MELNYPLKLRYLPMSQIIYPALNYSRDLKHNYVLLSGLHLLADHKILYHFSHKIPFPGMWFESFNTFLIKWQCIQFSIAQQGMQLSFFNQVTVHSIFHSSAGDATKFFYQVTVHSIFHSSAGEATEFFFNQVTVHLNTSYNLPSIEAQWTYWLKELIVKNPEMWDELIL